MKRLHVKVKGVVQGVGFRPFVYNLAKKLELKGFVLNTSEGVTIEIEGDKVEEFLEILKKSPPPLAKIYSVEITELPLNGYRTFEIIESSDASGFTHVSEDVSICKDCLRELFTPEDRRYLYPFINCTNCGPRYTITMKVPYDRPNTTMAVFQMCPDCLREYKDPTDRRFHAQPNACPKCGPQVRLFVKGKEGLREVEEPIKSSIALLKEGRILAIRGLGGFHLCCDATKAETVEELRKRKKRSNKPFALMSAEIEQIEKFCIVSESEKEILLSKERPIVLLRKRADLSLPDSLAPKNAYLGFMLPYTPLHYLLFYYPCENSAKPHFDALVMTSGNISEEPIIIKNQEAFDRLRDVADAFLVHNRDIFMRVDDSVVREFEGKVYFIRRARGFVPRAIPLGEELPEVLGVGADLKNTFTLIKGDSAIVSQHIGDMENLETLKFYEEVLNNLKNVYRVKPQALGHDLHPNYYSTDWAKEYAKREGIHAFAFQHHYSHIASLMAEYGLDELFGIAFDGTGYGNDGTIWGGEFLQCQIRGFRRLAHLRPISLPGGERAIKECFRIALSLIDDAYGEDLEVIERLPLRDVASEEKIVQILKLKRLSQFSPLSSGMGRLFDGIASILGICHYNTHEAEAAIALESLIDPKMEFSDRESYSFEILSNEENGTLTIDYRPLIRGLIEDILSLKELNMESLSKISWRFHNTVINMILTLSIYFKDKEGFDRVGLSGGVFQNGYVIKETVKALRRADIKPLFHEKVPCNDACISLGQAFLVAKRIKS